MSGIKRKHLDDPPEAIYSYKSRSRPSAEARIDPTYGQRSAIPGLDGDVAGGYEEELLYDDGMDALEYLRAVRHEATGIPNLLVAPRTPPPTDGREIYESGQGDFRGRYEDGAYFASEEQEGEDEFDDTADPQFAYFDSILARFHTLRAQLKNQPPPDAVSRLGSNHPTHLGALNKHNTRWWLNSIKQTDPKPAQIACMDKGSVLRLLRLMTKPSVLGGGLDVELGITLWVWSLLAKLPERGELTSEEIGIVRDLGKKAVLVGMGLKKQAEWVEGINALDNGDASDDDEEEEEPQPPPITNEDETSLDLDDEFDGEVHPEIDLPSAEADTDNSEKQDVTSESLEDLEAIKARLLERLQDQPEEAPINLEPEIQPQRASRTSAWNTRATVDMIITVAGEVYGQRDLLEFRAEWSDIM